MLSDHLPISGPSDLIIVCKVEQP